MSQFARKRTLKGLSLFGLGAQLVCLALVASLGQGVRAEETPAIAQVNTMDTATNAKELVGTVLSVNASPGTTTEQPPLLTAQTLTPPGTTSTSSADEDEPVDLLGDYNITAQRRRTTERENTVTTYSVNREQIRAFGARTVTDALKLIPGFTFADTLGGVTSDTSNFLRGLNSQRFLFLVDGSSQGRASNNRADTVGTLPVANVERIEVTFGGGTLRYGADAIAGVINVITTIPEGPPKVTINGQFGSFGFAQYDLNYSGSNGVPSTDAGYLGFELGYQSLSAINDYRYTYNFGTVGPTFINGVGPYLPGSAPVFPAPGVSLIDQNFTVNTRLKGGYVFSDFYYGKAVFKPGKEHTVTISVAQQNRTTGSAGNRTGCIAYGNAAVPSYYQTYYGVPFVTYCYSPAATSARTLEGDVRGQGDNRSSNTRGNVIWDWSLSELSSIRGQFAVNSTHLFFANPGSQRLITNRNIDGSLEYISEIFPGNTINLGYQFRTLRSTQASVAGYTPQNVPPSLDREATTNAIYFTDDWQLFNKALILNAGVRFTNAVAFGNFINYGAGFRYNFGSDDPSTAPFGLRFNYSTSFKQPSISDLYNSGVINPTTGPTFQQFLANPSLQPELGQGFDIGLDIAFSPTAVLRATYFRTDIVGYFGDGSPFIGNLPTIGGDPRGVTNCATEPIPTTANSCLAQTFQSRNAQSFLSTGFEFTFNWEFAQSWNLSLSQSFVDSRPVGTLGTDLAQFPFATNAGYYYDYQTADIPYSQTGILLTYTSPNFIAGLSGRFVGTRTTFGPFVTPGYGQWDATVRVPVSDNLSFTGGVFNTFDDRSILASSLRLSNSAGNAGIISPPTTFRGGIELTF
ncbi:TonB-dependent siderophore receptor [Candidatus Cyanaurora vandensis]|uniref:TonB-dependent receptor plug domain-containing protein n=1 Tax=Candidatus Cyanaurora vandensis TaxID=2714958 RepID=UPI00258084ED|nr:TonB-dependent receptor [Candidatus Cyanaurora vandensis]